MKKKGFMPELASASKRTMICLCSLLVVCAVLAMSTMWAQAQVIEPKYDDGGVAYIEWEPSTIDNPLGSAADFNAFLLGNMEDVVDVEGAVAIGGDLITGNLLENRAFTSAIKPTQVPDSYNTNASTFPSELYLPVGQFNIGMLVGGDVQNNSTGMVASHNGHVVFDNNTTVTGSFSYMYDGTNDTLHSADEAIRVDTAKFFEDAARDLTEMNKYLSELPANGVTDVRYNDQWDACIVLKGTNPVRNVFTLDMSDENTFKAMLVDSGAVSSSPTGTGGIFIDVPRGSDVIVNVIGGNTSNDNEVAFKLGSGEAPLISYDGGETYQHPAYAASTVIWNIDPSINSVVYCTDKSMYGTLFAPLANLTVNGFTDKNGKTYTPAGSGWNGIVIANDFINKVGTGTEAHYFPFSRRSERIGVVSFVKTNTGGEPLEGAVFTITNLADGSVAATVTTEADGIVALGGFAEGTYSITETSAPAGYTASAYTGYLHVDAAGNHAFVSSESDTTELDSSTVAAGFVNVAQGETPPVTGSFSFTKYAADGTTALSGAKFSLAGDTTLTAQSDASGLVSFENIPAGDYVLTETEAPANYIKSDESVEVTVAADGTVSYGGADLEKLFENAPKTGSFSFTKYAADGTTALSGAKFSLAGDTTLTAQSDASGLVSFENIPAGTYTLTETQAPANYIKSDESVEVTVAADGTVSYGSADLEKLFENAPKTGAFSFIKYAADGTTALSGAKFSLAGSTTLTAQSDASGLVSFDNIPAGTYTLTETQAPANYIKSDESVEVTVAADGTVSYGGADLEKLFENAPKTGAFSFTKYATDGTTALSGAKFTLAGDTTLTAQSDASGLVSFENIPAGTYTLTETQAPANYIKSDESVEVTVAADGTVSYGGADLEKLFENAPKTGAFSFTKYAADGTTALSGAKFSLAGDTTLTAQSDASGLVSFENIPAGTYTLTETQAPANYIKSDESVKIEVSLTGAVTYSTEIQNIDKNELQRSFWNAPKTGSFSFTKYAADGTTALSGAKFSLAGDTTLTAQSDASGLVSFENIPAGDYVLTETEAPANYIKSDESLEVTVAADGTVSFGSADLEKLFENAPKTGSFSFTKYAADGTTALSGAKFSLAGDTTLTAQSDSSGLVSFENIPAGTYTLTETQAPANYIKSDESLEVTVAADGTVSYGSADLEKLFENAPKTGSFSFTKYAADGTTALSGAKFSLAGDTTLTAQSDASGLVSFENIPAGDYVLTETEAPANYIKSDESLEVTVAADGTVSFGSADLEKLFENAPKTGSFSFTKYAADGTTALSGAKFSLAGDTTLTAQSDSSGLVSFENIPAGTYTLTETQAPANYIKSDESLEVTVAADGTVSYGSADLEKLFENAPKTGSFSFTKYAADGTTALSGAKFSLAGDTTLTAQSNASGLVSFENIPAGTYTLTETQAPANYIKSDESVEVTVAADGTVSYGGADLEKLFENAPKTGAFSFTKYATDGTTALSGAKFQIVSDDEDAQPIMATVTGAKVEFSGIPAGTYTLTETEAPEGYVISEESVTVTVAPDGTVTYETGGEAASAEDLEVLMRNAPVTADLSFTKKDGTGAPLKGATFNITSTDDGDTDITETFTDSTVVFENLAIGEYVVTETKAPKGYKKSSFELYVKVGDNGEITLFDGDDEEISIEEAEIFFFNNKIQVESDDELVVTPDERYIKVEEDYTLKAALKSDPTLKPNDFTWKSSDESIATVDENGKVTGIKDGVVIITASYGGLSDSSTITVYSEPVPITNIKITGKDNAGVNEKIPLTAEVYPLENTENDVVIKWESSDPSVATVDNNGVVTTLKKGTVTITARYGDKVIGTFVLGVSSTGDNNNGLKGDSPNTGDTDTPVRTGDKTPVAAWVLWIIAGMLVVLAGTLITRWKLQCRKACSK